MNKPVLDALHNASEGLLYPSETDAPFEAFSWGKAKGALTPAAVARLAGASAKMLVEEQPLDEFFKNLITEGENADRYRTLQQVIGELLVGAKAFRIGQVEIDVFLVGQTKDGEWAGMKTKAVET